MVAEEAGGKRRFFGPYLGVDWSVELLEVAGSCSDNGDVAEELDKTAGAYTASVEESSPEPLDCQMQHLLQGEVVS